MGRLWASISAPILRLSLGERATAGGLLVLFVGLFFPWMGGATLPECDPAQSICSVPGSSKNGFNGVGIAVVAVVFIAMAFFVVRSPVTRALGALRPLSMADGLLYFVVAGATLIGVFVFVGEYHAVNGTTRSPQPGFWVMVGGALVLATSGLVMSRRARLSSPWAPPPTDLGTSWQRSDSPGTTSVERQDERAIEGGSDSAPVA